MSIHSTNILKEAKSVFDKEIESLETVREILDDNFESLVELIHQSNGRVIVTGMGKAGHIGRKIAATMSSLGTVAYFVHPAEGLHGDLGGITNDDIVIALSKSGESDEVIGLIPSIKQIGATLISVTCKDSSSLSDNADLKIVLPIKQEACTHQLAPTTSTTVMLVFGDALAVVLSKLNNFKPEDFAIFHPSGSLGKRLLLRVSSLMAEGENNPVVNASADLKETIMIMSSRGLGGVSVINDSGELVGLVTDGDLRRTIEQKNDTDILKLEASEIMTKNPTYINENEKAVKALEIMQSKDRQISILPVVNKQKKVVGMLRIHEVIRAGIV
ncbi:arabinose-5-phosphate isomerase [Gracilibacillus halotolerans]|uniref:Arabinose-5-phosphate isomerase n=1 Tax=Gracilibacillus halotolerans TaxID=74386 RepID=A0A841RJZ0_9BACI|nr:KpsF/GutQ family sugar-phosphate isomerase [Gracilibacillus halotolerans]MBB6512292.1 arabinose-5-phosphate isomerase [Gracilibacillus halotolerans]